MGPKGQKEAKLWLEKIGLELIKCLLVELKI